MASQISMIGGEYKVRTITGDEFDVIYTRSSVTVKGCLTRFRRMFENSKNEWVAGLDVEYTTVLVVDLSQQMSLVSRLSRETNTSMW